MDKEIVDTIGKLKCPLHPNAKFKKVEKGSDTESILLPFFINRDERKFDSYICEGQGNNPCRLSRAYDCPNCGIVEDIPLYHDHEAGEPGPYWMVSYREYSCRICKTSLGKIITGEF